MYDRTRELSRFASAVTNARNGVDAQIRIRAQLPGPQWEGYSISMVNDAIAPNGIVTVDNTNKTIVFHIVEGQTTAEHLVNTLNGDIEASQLFIASNIGTGAGLVSRADTAKTSTILFVGSAGNEAQRYYRSSFHPVAISVSDVSGLPAGNYHAFEPATATDPAIVLNRMVVRPVADNVRGNDSDIYLHWNDDFDFATTSLSLVAIVRDASGDILYIDTVEIDSQALGHISIPISSTQAASVDIAIRHESGSQDIDVVLISDDELSYISAVGSIGDDITLPEMMGIGAVHADQPLQPATYSSRGPFQEFLVETGTFSETIDSLSVVAPSKVSISGAGGFGKSISDENGNKRTSFSGTSAASPHAAAAAALLKQAFPDATWQQIQSAIEQQARDLTLGAVAIDDLVLVNQQQTPLDDLLVNDYSPTGSDLNIVGVDRAGLQGSITTDPGPGTGLTGLVYHRPNSPSNAVERFEYTIRDSAGIESSATVNLFLGFEFAHVTANSDLYEVDPDSATTFTVIENDFTASTIDRSQLVVEVGPFNSRSGRGCWARSGRGHLPSAGRVCGC